MKTNKLLLISLLSIALWHCGNKEEPGDNAGDNASDLIVMDIMPSSTKVAASKMIMLEATVSNTGKGSSPERNDRLYGRARFLHTGRIKTLQVLGSGYHQYAGDSRGQIGARA